MQAKAIPYGEATELRIAVRCANPKCRRERLTWIGGTSWACLCGTANPIAKPAAMPSIEIRPEFLTRPAKLGRRAIDFGNAPVAYLGEERRVGVTDRRTGL